MQKVFPSSVTWLSSFLEERAAPNYSRKAHMLRIKQTDGLDITTVPTILRPPLP
jgi:hypothetical protein